MFFFGKNISKNSLISKNPKVKKLAILITTTLTIILQFYLSFYYIY